jgi:DNA-binding NarL/FixJ family response regulator
MHDSEDYVFQALRAGATGYLLKSVADRELPVACRAAIRGDPWLYPGAITALTREHVARAGKSETLADDALSPREAEVVRLIAGRHTNKEIAEILMISRRTVGRDRAKILAKLQLRDTTELIDYAIRRGLTEP